MELSDGGVANTPETAEVCLRPNNSHSTFFPTAFSGEPNNVTARFSEITIDCLLFNTCEVLPDLRLKVNTSKKLLPANNPDDFTALSFHLIGTYWLYFWSERIDMDCSTSGRSIFITCDNGPWVASWMMMLPFSLLFSITWYRLASFLWNLSNFSLL